ncbi:hypothetical protein AOY81_04790 [Escherichia coli]|nr:hypothetical protein AOY81_04790 [Escherichia coli]
MMNSNNPALIHSASAGIKKITCQYISYLPGIVLYDSIPLTEYSAELLISHTVKEAISCFRL